MNPYAIPPLITNIAIFCIGLFVYLKNKHSKINITLSLFCLSLTIWLFGFGGMYLSKEPIHALTWARIGFMGVAFIPVSAYHFIITLLGLKQKRIIISLYLIAILSLILGWTNYVYNGVARYFWGHYPTAGSLYFIFLGMFATLFSLGIILLYFGMGRAKRQKRPLLAQQIKYVFFAFLCGTTGLIDYIIKYKIEIYPWGYISALIFISLIAYAILKYHLMDITIAIKKTTLLAMGVLLPVGGVFMLISMLQPKLMAIMGERWWLIPSGVTVLLTLGLFRFVSYIIRLKDEELDRNIKRYREELKRHVQHLAKAKSRRELALYTVRHLSRIAQLDFVGVALRKEENITEEGLPKKVSYYIIEAVVNKTDKDLSYLKQKRLKEDEPLIVYLKKNHVYLEKGYLQFRLENESLPVAQKTLLNSLIEEMNKLNTEVVFPAISGEELVGILLLGNKLSGSVYSQDDLESFSFHCTEVAKPIAEILARDEVIRVILATCHSYLKTLEARDRYTRGHTERVKKISLGLAQEEPLKSEIEKIPDGKWGLELASQLHDLGKVGISDHILTKPERLTEEEFKEIKKHPERAISMMGEISIWLKEDVISGIVQHQEHFDGKGYPRGLDDDAIHIYARIIHTADALDAMTSKRPYRDALSLEEAIEEIKKNNGTQFDPFVVGVLIKLYQRGVLKQVIEESKNLRQDEPGNLSLN